MENMINDQESLPNLFIDNDNEIDFDHSRSNDSNDDSFFQSFRIQERDQTRKKARKLVATPMKWKSNTRKIAYQTGKSYVSKRGKTVAERRVKTLKNCNLQCKFKCGENISDAERSVIHDVYYSLSTATEKRHFLINTTCRLLTAKPKRLKTDKRLKTEDDDLMDGEDEAVDEKKKRKIKSSRRKFSFKYYFFVNGEKIQVCKSFYLGTLSISQRPVYTAHSTKNVETNSPTQDQRGKNVNSRRVPKGDLALAREHIKSFPIVESHYCEAHKKREYLGSHLSIGKMYELYLQKCCTEKIAAVRKSMYYRIFVTEFNLGFYSPKSDPCDLCKKLKGAKQTETLMNAIKYKYEVHENDHARS